MTHGEIGTLTKRVGRVVRRLGLHAGAKGLRLLVGLRSNPAIVPETPTGVAVFDETIETNRGQTPIEVFVPRRDSSSDELESDEPLPVYINFHGGGFVLGDPAMDAAACRWLASAVPCIVVNVDYALAPENPFPIAVEECTDVLTAIHEPPDGTRPDPLLEGGVDVDRDRIAVGGQSAGGNVAAVLARFARDHEIPLTYQVLNYPPLDLAIDPGTRPHEHDEVLSPGIARFFNACYLSSNGDPRDPRASPVYGDDFTGLAPALVITAEYDMLRIDGARYAASLTDAGVDVVHHEFEDCHHGFTHTGPPDRAVEAWELIATHLRKAFDES